MSSTFLHCYCSIFLQYLQNHVFVVSETFLRAHIFNEQASFEPSFKMEVLMNLPPDVCCQLLQGDPIFRRHVIETLLARLERNQALEGTELYPFSGLDVEDPELQRVLTRHNGQVFLPLLMFLKAYSITGGTSQEEEYTKNGLTQLLDFQLDEDRSRGRGQTSCGLVDVEERVTMRRNLVEDDLGTSQVEEQEEEFARCVEQLRTGVWPSIGHRSTKVEVESLSPSEAIRIRAAVPTPSQ